MEWLQYAAEGGSLLALLMFGYWFFVHHLPAERKERASDRESNATEQARARGEFLDALERKDEANERLAKDFTKTLKSLVNGKPIGSDTVDL